MRYTSKRFMQTFGASRQEAKTTHPHHQTNQLISAIRNTPQPAHNGTYGRPCHGIILSMAANRYGLSEADLNRLRQRDQLCVHCHKAMVPSGSDGPRTNWATIEHLNHEPPWDDSKTVAICCGSCNSSRVNRLLRDWFKGEYCRTRGIDRTSVAKPVRDYLRDIENHH
jgi:hypothetical protein